MWFNKYMNVSSTIKKYFVYIVKCSDNTYYTGKTVDISKRVLQHNGELPNGAKYTRTRRPVELVHFEEYLTNALAFKREREIKKMKRADKNYLIYHHNIQIIERIQGK